ncbi:unnamed protein product [Cercopithifilaria johnstoni]|uniref:Prominin-like protein n=1 Tax=Cercopithifilaria johnstoni TaxID=2874296 RepID=A0A8J2PZY1_9BILA|nr:unnamed protein product [Cercopithifilaria johnstoni]
MKLIEIICLSVLNFNQVDSTNISQVELLARCPRYEISLTKVDYSFGLIDPFYSFVQNIYHNVQLNMNDCYRKKLVNIILSSNNHFLTDYIHHLLLKQPWIITLLILSVLYIIIVPICGILFFCDLCTCATASSISSSKILTITGESKSSKYLFALNLTMMTIVLMVILILTVVYIKSVSYAVIGTDRIHQSMDGIYTDINFLIISTSNDLTCKLNKTLRKLSAGINDTIQQFPNRTIKALQQDCPIATLPMVIERFEIKNVTHFINDVILSIKSTKLLASKLPNSIYRQSSMQNMNSTLERIENRLATLLQQYNDIFKIANNTRNNVEFLLDNITGKVIYFYSNFEIAFKFKNECDRNRSKQQGYWRCAGVWSLHAAGAAFFTGWIMMLIASITFLGAFGVETICQPFFRDEQMHLYRSPYFNSAIAHLINFSESSVGIG